MPRKGSQKIAVLLCKFNDSPNVEPHAKSHYEDLVVKRGTGGLNDYWIAASLGNIDLDGSKVFGWKTLAAKRADFLKDHPGRHDKVLAAAAAHGVKLADWATVIAIYNENVGDAGSQGGVLAGPDDTSVTFLAHETGHMFALDHSFDQSTRKTDTWSAPGEYWDKFDIMSAMNVHTTSHAQFGARGPLACVAHLDLMDWLSAGRVWRPGSTNSSTAEVFELVSLGHPEIPGYIAAIVAGRYIEFRTKDGWDAGIPKAAVLIHTLAGPNPVVQAYDKSKWTNYWLPGQKYGPPDFQMSVNGGVQVEVVSFDLAAKKARIHVRVAAGRRWEVGPGITVGGVDVGGGGLLILPSGKIVRVPPRGPLIRLAKNLGIAAEAQEYLDAKERKAVTRTAYGAMAKTLKSALKGGG
jgi:hypothetical protein